jgi:heme exporter protein CcmD
MPDLHTGEYGVFIWWGFGITALAFAGMIADSLLRARKWKRRVDELEGPSLEGRAQ